MIITYKILAVNEDDQTILVRYYSDAHPENELVAERAADGSILRGRCEWTFTIYDRSVLANAEALHTYLMSQAPYEWLQMKKTVKENPNETRMTVAVQKVGQEVSVDVGGQTQPTPRAVQRPAIDVASLLAEV